MSDSSPSASKPATISPEQERLSFATKLAFGAGDLGPAITANVLVFFLLYFFTQVAGLPAGMAGSILLIGKISDAINDPVVGLLSDRTRSRWGRRLPWLLAGAVPFGILFFLQWLVPQFSANDTINDWGLFGYYVVIGVLFNIAYTMVNLPYTALTPELTQDYNERTSLNSFRFAFSLGGSMLSLILAGLIFSAFPGNSLRQYWVMGALLAVLAVLPLFWCTFVLQERNAQAILTRSSRQGLGIGLIAIAVVLVGFGLFRLGTQGFELWAMVALIYALVLGAFGYSAFTSALRADLEQRPPITTQDSTVSLPIPQQLKIVFNNKPFLYVTGIYLCSWLAIQLTASILPYFVVSWMGLPDAAFPQVALAVQGTALVMLFTWSSISKRIGKKAVYTLGVFLWLIAQSGLFFVQPGQVGLMYALAVLAGFGVSVSYLIPWSMVPDVIELDQLRTGQRREGIFYAFMVFLQKLGLALGLFLVGQALELAGFIESVPGQPVPTQPESALLAIRLAVGPLPAIFLIGGLILAYFYPITREFHDRIRLELAERQGQAKE